MTYTVTANKPDFINHRLWLEAMGFCDAWYFHTISFHIASMDYRDDVIHDLIMSHNAFHEEI